MPSKCVLPIIVLLTSLGIGISVICLSFGFTVVFQNLFYIPIILTCVCFTKRGLLFTSAISLVYLALMIAIPKNPSLIPLALIRICFFELVAAVIVRLTKERNKTMNLLEKQNMEVEDFVRQQTGMLAEKLEQSQRLEKAYRDTAQYHESCLDQLDIAVVQWNSEMYITNTNPAFDNLLGRSQNDLVGRKLSSIPFLEQAARSRSNTPIKTEFRAENGVSHTVLWMFSDIFISGQSTPDDTIGQGMEIGNQETTR